MYSKRRSKRAPGSVAAPWKFQLVLTMQNAEPHDALASWINAHSVSAPANSAFAAYEASTTSYLLRNPIAFSLFEPL